MHSSQGLLHDNVYSTLCSLLWLCGSSVGGIPLTDKGLGCGCYGSLIQFKWSCMIVVKSLGIKAAD